jgi:two-component system chemotaxis sensor kinase CheA
MANGRIDKSKFLEEFIPDGKDLTAKAEGQLLELEKRLETKDEVDPEFLNSIFRSFHTLKGTAGFFELKTIVELTHAAETLLDDLRNGEYPASIDLTNILIQTCDVLNRILENLGSEEEDQVLKKEARELTDELNHLVQKMKITKIKIEKPAAKSMEKYGLFDEKKEEHSGYGIFSEEEKKAKLQTSDIHKRYIRNSLDMVGQIENFLLVLEKEPYETEILDRIYQVIHNLKGNSGIVGFENLVKLLSLIEDQLSEYRDKSSPLSKEELATLFTSADLLTQIFEDLKSKEKPENENLEEIINKVKQSRVKKLGEILVDLGLVNEDVIAKALKGQDRPKLGESLVQSGYIKNDDLKKALDVQSQAKENQKSIRKELSDFSKKRLSSEISDIRISTSKIDLLMDLIGELVIAESMVTQNPELQGLELDNFKKSATHLNKIIRNLQEVALAIRMIPISGVFQRMSRLVRDLSRKFDKSVDLVLIGEETEVDKTVIEKISDPLVHLIRNCLDHGLEDKEERLESAKPERGKIVLEAKHSGNEVWIVVKDDGRGLDRNKIFAKALQRGLVTENDKDMEDSRVWDLIFHPGLSTAAEVTDVSGRGVGMDVVKKNLMQINGKIDIKSIRGEGTAFLLRIPLTLAIIEGMVVRYGRQYYIIPTIEIKESVNLMNMNVKKISDNEEIMKFRGHYIPIVSIGELLELEHERKFNSERPLVVVLEQGGKFLGIKIDEIIGNQSIVIKSLSDYIKNTKGVSGCTILGNGEVSLILDISYLVNQYNYDNIQATAAI